MSTATTKVLNLAKSMLGTHDDPQQHRDAVLVALRKNKKLLAAFTGEAVESAVLELVYEARYDEHTEMKKAAVYLPPKKCPRSLEAAESASAAKSQAAPDLLNYKMPNGKKLRDCTYKELKNAIEWATEIMKGWRIDIKWWSSLLRKMNARSKKQTVGSVFTSQQVRLAYVNARK
jgi:hypothetical protein